MPRRPRPTTRAPPRSKRLHSDDEEERDENPEELREDQPRFAQWVPEDELDSSNSGSSSQHEPEPRSDSELNLNSDAGSDSGSDSNSDAPVTESSKPAKPEWVTAKRKKDIEKRSNKHAPTEITSKRPVSRHRAIIDVPTIASRDPRFMPLSGQLSQTHFSRAYSFLPEIQKSEADTLRESLAKARKQRAAPETIGKLERALKHAESAVERARREEREREALAKVKKEEKEKRGEGKGAWFMKKSEKRNILLQAKFDDLAVSGGQNAVRKAIEKRKKKIAQKEKKARPFSKAQAKAFAQGQGGSGGRTSDNGWGSRTGGSGGDRKRRRV